MPPRPGNRSRRAWNIGVAAGALILMLGTLGLFIARSQDEARSQLAANFKLRGTASATLVSTYIGQQADRQKASAQELLSTPSVSQERFRTVASAFGTQGAVLLDSHGRVIDVTPYEKDLIGRNVAADYPSAKQAERGAVSVSGVLPTQSGLESVAAIGVPFQTVIVGRRVFAAAYRVGGTQLRAFVAHAIAYPQHQVLLIDERGELLASSPSTTAASIWGADLPLAEALAQHSTGEVSGAKVPSTFTVAKIPGTPWRMVLMVPNSKLYASINGNTKWIPWIVFGLVTLLGLLLVLLFARSMADRARLSHLSAELEAMARTDSLTGLMNRRGFQENLTRAAALSRRRGEPLSILMIDLDRFKEVNDTHGHEAGDRVLVALADCLRNSMRAHDIYGRLGGDEFIVALTEADEAAAKVAAERLAATAAAVDLSDLGLSEGVPMSIGTASGLHTTPEELIRAADAELYRVKNARRAGTRGMPAGTGR
jgi:diguanylate cyclase (GGDEF)-like protein